MKFDLIATDFDDTLFPSTKVISEYTKSVIDRYIGQGGIFVLSSGRMFQSIAAEARALGLHGYAICYQGALTRDIDTLKTFDFVPMACDLAVEYVDFCKTYTSTIQVYVDDSLYVLENNKYTERYGALCKVAPVEKPDMAEFLMTTKGIIHKVYCHVGNERCAEMRAAAQERFGDRLLINSSKPYNVEAVDIRASKGRALKKLAESYGIAQGKIAAFGDNLNDLDMIASAGFGVAVGNAVEELKRVADYVAPCDVEDGVAKTIEKYCLGEDL